MPRGLGKVQRHFLLSLIVPTEALQEPRWLGILHGLRLCLCILDGADLYPYILLAPHLRSGTSSLIDARLWPGAARRTNMRLVPGAARRTNMRLVFSRPLLGQFARARPLHAHFAQAGPAFARVGPVSLHLPRPPKPGIP
jgi:hypothetical protein